MGLYERVSRWAEVHRLGVDASVTAAATLLMVPVLLSFGYGNAADGGLVLWSVLVVSPLAWRRTRPAASAAAVYAVALAHLLVGEPLVPGDVAVLVALFSVTVYGPVWAHRVAITGGVVGTVLLGAALGTAGDVADIARSTILTGVLGTTTFLAVWAFGLVRRSRRETLAALRDRADRLETERDQQAQLATSAERSRIAREMHDIVAHSLSVIIAQADGGRYAAQQDPAAATRALGTVAETGRAALGDMRRLLGVLRTDGSVETVPGTRAFRADARPTAHARTGQVGPTRAVGRGSASDASSGATVVPQPGPQDLDSLLDQVRESGTPVSLVAVGPARELPLGAGLTVYRIVQESLTNVMKHGGPGARATVLVRWRTDAVDVEVQDDGRGAAAATDSPGYGILGMRERVAVFGGYLRTGPRPGGGFAVRARIPVPGGDRWTSPSAVPAEHTAPHDTTQEST